MQYLDEILGYFRIHEFGPGGWVTMRQKIFFRFLAVLGHSESILNFCKNDGGEGGGGPKFVYPEFTEGKIIYTLT